MTRGISPNHFALHTIDNRASGSKVRGRTSLHKQALVVAVVGIAASGIAGRIGEGADGWPTRVNCCVGWVARAVHPFGRNKFRLERIERKRVDTEGERGGRLGKSDDE